MAKTGMAGKEKEGKAISAQNAQNAQRRTEIKEAKKSAGVDAMKEAIEKAGVLMDEEDDIGHSTKAAMQERIPALEDIKVTNAIVEAENTDSTEDAEVEQIEVAEDETMKEETVKSGEVKDEAVKSETMNGETADKKIAEKEPVTEERKGYWRSLMGYYGIEQTVFAKVWFDARCKGILADRDELDQAEYAGVLLAQTEYFWQHYCNYSVGYEIAGGKKGNCMLLTPQGRGLAEKYEFTLEDVGEIHSVINDMLEGSLALCERIRHDVIGRSRSWRMECSIESEAAPFAAGSSYLYWYFAFKDLRMRGYRVNEALNEFGLIEIELPDALRKWDRAEPVYLPETEYGLQKLMEWCNLQEQKAVDEANLMARVQICMKLAAAVNLEHTYGVTGARFENCYTDESGILNRESYDLSTMDGLEKFVASLEGFTAMTAADALRYELASLHWQCLNYEELLKQQEAASKTWRKMNLDRAEALGQDKNYITPKDERQIMDAANGMTLQFYTAGGIFKEYGTGKAYELVMDIVNELMR